MCSTWCSVSSFECSVCRRWWDQGLLKMFWIQPKSIPSSLFIIWPKSISMESFHWKIRQVAQICVFSVCGEHDIITFCLFCLVSSLSIDDLPHWVLSAMKCLANCKLCYLWSRNEYFKCYYSQFKITFIMYFCIYDMNIRLIDFIIMLCHFPIHQGPKYDSNQPSYPGFERDVFKTVSDYFYSLPQPLLTYQYYELFVNILGMYEAQMIDWTTLFSTDNIFFLSTKSAY